MLLFEIIDRFIRQRQEVSGLTDVIVQSGKFEQGVKLNSTANYLFTKIMEQIRSTPNVIAQRHNQLLQALQDIHFLFYQDMFSECHKVIMEAKELALAIDRPAYILELQIWEARVVTRTSNVSWNIDDMQQEMLKTLENIQSTHYTFLEAQQLFVALKKTEGSVSPVVAQLMKKVELQKEEPLDALQPRLHYWKLVRLQYYNELHLAMGRKNSESQLLQARLNDKLQYLKQNLDFMAGEGKIMAEEEPVNYISALENYLNTCLEIRDKESVSLLESEFVKNYVKKEDAYRYRIICYYKMLAFLRFNQFDEACEYIESQNLEINLKNRQHVISDHRMSVIRYCCIQAYFLSGKFEKALIWTELLIENPRSQSNPLVFQISELLYPICLFETKRLGNIRMRFGNLIKKFKRREPENNFLQDLVLTLRMATKGPYSSITGQQNQKLRVYLEKNKFLSAYGPVLAWIDSKLSGKPLSEEIIKYNI